MGRCSAALPILLWLACHDGADSFHLGRICRASLLTRPATSSEGDLDATADAIASVNAALDEIEETVQSAVSQNDSSRSTSTPGMTPNAAGRNTTLEERISADVASTASSTIGSTFGRSYAAYRAALHDSKDRTQKRLERSAYAKERASRKIAALREKMEREKRKVEVELQAKIEETQAKIDEEVERMSSLLQQEILLERAREVQISELTDTLKSSIAAKQADIKIEEGITAEMAEVRTKLKPGTIASQLDTLLAQKRDISAIERNLVEDLKECLTEMISILDDCRQRSSKFEEVLSRIVRPVAALAGEKKYEWSDIDEMEDVLGRAAASAVESDKRVRELQKRIEETMLTKSAVLEEEAPVGAADNTLAKKMIKADIQPVLAEITDSEVKFRDLKDKDESEVAGVLAKSLGKAAISGSKAAIFGLKAVLDTITSKPVSDAANDAAKTSSGLMKDLSGVSGEIKSDTGGDLKKIAQSETFRGALKSTGATVGSVGNTGKEIVANVGKTEASKKSADALKDASKDVLSAANALAALGVKSVRKMRARISEVKAEIREKDATKKQQDGKNVNGTSD